MNARELERVVLRYLETRNNGWTWVLGNKVYTKEETIKLFKKNKRFRKMIMEQILKLAIDLFSKAIPEEEK